MRKIHLNFKISDFKVHSIFMQINSKQESIPVGYVPPALVVTTRCHYLWELGPQVNRFKQISRSDVHKG